MRSIFFIVSFISSVMSYSYENCQQGLGNSHWMCSYMKKHGRIYKHEAEFFKKKELVERRIKNAQKTIPNNMGMTSMLDQHFHANIWLREQIISKNKLKTTKHPESFLLKQYQLPEELDLRDKLQPIKNQGQCGSCYTFAAVAALEYYAGQAISEQKLMDCTSSENGPSYGCNGGWSETLFEYAMSYPVVSESDQPYTAANAACNQTCSDTVVRVQRFSTLENEKDTDSEKRIPYMLNEFGPLVVAIDVGTTELLMSYEGDIFPGIACGTALDHAVTIVGYTPDYWIVRNSWGTDWGADGYFYLERGVNACGVASYISYISKAE